MKLYRAFRCVLVFLVLWAGSAQAGVQCDAVDDALTTGVALSQFATAAAYTLTTWLKVEGSAQSAGTCYEAASILGDADGNVSLGRQGTSTFCGQAFGGGTLVTGTATAGWHHLGLRLSGGTLSLWVDGVSVSALAADNIGVLDQTVKGCVMGIGALPPDRLEDTRWYNVAVPDAELEYMGKSRVRGVGRTAPTAHWHFDTCADGVSAQGHQFVDRSGNGRHITGDDGANNTGLTCHGAEFVRRRGGVQ